MKIVFDYLDQLDFKKWWIKTNAHKIKGNPLLTPTDEDYEAYIQEKLKEEGTSI